MTNPPTLSEMQNLLSGGDVTPPTLSEMSHALDEEHPSPPSLAFMEAASNEVYLIHYGVKGMQWGIRRTREALSRSRGSKVKNDDGDVVGELGVNGRSAAKKLKGMKAGEVIVVDTESGPRVMVKLKDDTFRETSLSADAQAVLRTVNKQPSERSTRELKEANARAKAIEEYNKIFNPLDDPNATLKARAEAMELRAKVAQAQARMNPSRTQRVSGFIKDVTPIFETFQKVDNSLGGHLAANLKAEWEKARSSPTSTASTASTSTSTPKPKKAKKKKTPVYDITSLDVDPFPTGPTSYSSTPNPYIPELGGN